MSRTTFNFAQPDLTAPCIRRQFGLRQTPIFSPSGNGGETIIYHGSNHLSWNSPLTLPYPFQLERRYDDIFCVFRQTLKQLEISGRQNNHSGAIGRYKMLRFVSHHCTSIIRPATRRYPDDVDDDKILAEYHAPITHTQPP